MEIKNLFSKYSGQIFLTESIINLTLSVIWLILLLEQVDQIINKKQMYEHNEFKHWKLKLKINLLLDL